MYGDNFRAPKVDVHEFAMIPRADIPRSSFRMQSQHKTTFGASNLIPIFIQEVVPGDSFNVSMTCFSRMSTPLVPILDNMDIESWFFFVPCRLVWSHWINFMGEQTASPSDSISYVIPQVNSPAGGFAAFSVFDYFGCPGAGQISAGSNSSVSALPFRAYSMIWNDWFRDENLQAAAGYGATNSVFDIGDGPDPYTNYALLPVNKRHDYFTACLPFTQKGPAVQTGISGHATVFPSATQLISGANNAVILQQTSGGGMPLNVALGVGQAESIIQSTAVAGPGNFNSSVPYFANLYADLSTATAQTVNALRLAFQTQKLLERDARGGTRYTEIIRSHFGVISPDMRLQRPEYLGGGRSPVSITPVPQTSATGLTGGTTPQGQLAAVGTSVLRQHGFRQSFTEHGYVIGMAAVRRDQVYQQGLRRLWTRSTRYDFYFPVFAMLGEQSVYNYEIFNDGNPGDGNDASTFGYQERWAEYRYFPSMVTGAFRSTYAAPLDYWHLAENFGSRPALNSVFIKDETQVVLERALALGSAGANEQFLCDFFFDIRCARPMPMYSVPGLIDHF